MSRPILVSACLLGLRTRFDNTSKNNLKVRAFLEDNGLVAIPVCPEQLAGLPTPRPRTEFAAGDGNAVLDDDGRVVNENGLVVNETFLRGATETLKIAQLNGCIEALFKERSPSCGVLRIYRQGKVTSGSGVTSALLQRHGLTVFSEEQLP